MALTTWELDHAHSSIDFTVRHMLVSKVRGSFRKWTGVLEIDEKDLSKSRVAVTIDVASVDTHEAQRDTHLRSADFFEAEKHPHIIFESTRVEPKGENLSVTGNLTIRGTKREVVLDVERGGIIAKDPWGKRRAGFTATTTIDRKEFGVLYNQVLDHGGFALGDKVAITIEIEATTAVTATDSAQAVSP